MNRNTIFIVMLLATLAIAASALAIESVVINDRGSVRVDAGTVVQVNRDQSQSHAGTTLYARKRIPFLHGIVPDDGDIMQSFKLSGITFTRNDFTCISADTLIGEMVLAFSYNEQRLDSIGDTFAEPIARARVIVPPTGITERTFFSSMVRRQENGWDDFVVAMRSVLNRNTPFVIRFEAFGKSGLNLDLSQAQLTYTIDREAEEPLLDACFSPVPLKYLSPDTLSPNCWRSFHGIVISVPYQRTPWTSGCIKLNSWFPNEGNVVTHWWTVTPVWANENQTCGFMTFGLPLSYINSQPNMRITANLEHSGGNITCRSDGITLRVQP